MGIIEELDKMYLTKNQKTEEAHKNVIENYLKENDIIIKINDMQPKLEKLEKEMVDLKKKVNKLEVDNCIIGGATLD